MSGHTMEEVAAATEGPRWFQLYPLGGRVGAEQLVRRARASGYDALVVTVDTPIPGNRERDLRHGVALPLRFTRQTARRFAPQAVVRPRWLYDFARDGFSMDLALSQGLGPPERADEPDEALIHWVVSPVTWDGRRLAEARPSTAPSSPRAWSPRTMRSARWTRAATAVIVSNHGGRQLDGVTATLDALPEVVDAVGGRGRGADRRRGPPRARTSSRRSPSGARAVLVGRPCAFGLGAAGEPGVATRPRDAPQRARSDAAALGVGSVRGLDASICGVLIGLPAEAGPRPASGLRGSERPLGPRVAKPAANR